MTTAKKYPRSARSRDAQRLVARQYSTANLKKPPSYFDDSCIVNWGNQDNYQVLKQIGKGKYGEVYEGRNVVTNQRCVIKIMRPVKEHRLRREIKILAHVKDGPNTVTLHEVVRDPDTKTPSFIFEFVDAIGFRELQSSVTDMDVRLYMYQLLRALNYCHSKGIMHRDVKPGNVLIDHKTKELRLIDWGLADFYHPGKEYPVRVATRFYKGPELLVDIRDYDYSLDVWGVGCMMAALVFKKPVFFRGEDEFDQLVKIAKVLGSEGLHRYCEKYGIDLDPRLEQLVGIRPQIPWRRFVNADNAHLCNNEAFDLLDQILRYDHNTRLTCAEAMEHSYFAPVRQMEQQQQQQQQQQHQASGNSSYEASTQQQTIGGGSSSNSAVQPHRHRRQQQQHHHQHMVQHNQGSTEQQQGQQHLDGEDTILPDACTVQAKVTAGPPAPVDHMHAPKGPAVAAVAPPAEGPGATAVPAATGRADKGGGRGGGAGVQMDSGMAGASLSVLA